MPPISGFTSVSRSIYETILLKGSNSNVGLALFNESHNGAAGLYV